jgi:hypothetical protein
MRKLTFSLLLLLASQALFAQQSITVSPTSGPAVGGTTVTLTGALGGCPIVPPCNAPTVRFGNSVAITATEISGTQVSVVTPAHEPGTVDLIVTTRNGQTITLANAFTFVANTHANWERVIIPVAVKSLAGNFGSLWTTDIAAFNAGNSQIHLEDCIAGTCVGPSNNPPLAPGQARYFNFQYLFDAPAAIVWVPQTEIGGLRLSARFRDLSRQAETFGSELPIVRESEIGTGTLHILDIPTDERFRVNLRVYDIDARRNNSISVRVISMNGEESLALTAPVAMHIAEEQVDELYGYAQVSLDSVIATSRFPTVRIEVTASDPATRLWGFVSVTNNETQQTTIVSPQ